MLPNFLIVGSMKCGTSALFRGVVNHDDVFGARGKELHYFDRNYDKGPEWYMAHFADNGRATAVGEGTPYLSDEPSMQLIVNDLPHAQMVAIVRQPSTAPTPITGTTVVGNETIGHSWKRSRRMPKAPRQLARG